MSDSSGNNLSLKYKMENEFLNTANPTQRRIKKIPPGLRQPKINYKAERNLLKRFVLRLKNDSQYFRLILQITFGLLIVWIGIEFFLFVRWGESAGRLPFYGRPPGVEGFLPISALMSLKYWLQTGVINDVHPSGLFVLVAIILLGALLRKSFCGWLCPIGTVSESLWRLGKKLFKNNLTITKYLDYPLRSIKYVLLGFFLYAIFVSMDVQSLKVFIYSPYNKVADIKMYYFFAQISSFALWTLIVLAFLSLVIKNFWCRYLCPYGALLGALGFLSPIKIKRNKTTCVDCNLCTKVCPSLIKVHKADTVWSDECTGCLECVQVCPVRDTLELKLHFTDSKVSNWIFASLIIGVFVGITGLAVLTGNWQNKISKEEYLKRFKELDSPLYQHNQGRVTEYGPND
jgi:polyferredoxin